MRSGGYIRVNWTDTHFNKRLYRAVGTLGGCWRMLLLLLLLLHRASVPYLWFTGFRLSSIKSQPPEVNGGLPYSADDELFRLQAQNENLKLCLLCLVRLSFGSVDVALQIVGRRVVNRVNFKFLLLSLHYTLLILFAGQPPDENNILCDSSSTPLLPHMQRAYSNRARSTQLFAYPITIHFRLLFT